MALYTNIPTGIVAHMINTVILDTYLCYHAMHNNGCHDQLLPMYARLIQA